MKHTDKRFEAFDTVVQMKFDQPIRLGTIIKGPFEVEKCDHYHVKWIWEHPTEFKSTTLPGNTDLICDTESRKYRYAKAY